MAATNRVLVKMRPQAARAAAAASQTNLRPLYESAPAAGGFGVEAAPQWYLADLPDGGPNPWDIAHAQVADQLGVSESNIVAAEPDLAQSYPDVNEAGAPGRAFAAGSDCNPAGPLQQDGKIPNGPGFAWHL